MYSATVWKGRERGHVRSSLGGNVTLVRHILPIDLHRISNRCQMVMVDTDCAIDRIVDAAEQELLIGDRHFV